MNAYGPAISGKWLRRRFHYECREQYIVGAITYSRTSKLGFFAYHGIRLIHGQKALDAMANYLKRELGV